MEHTEKPKNSSEKFKTQAKKLKNSSKKLKVSANPLGPKKRLLKRQVNYFFSIMKRKQKQNCVE